MWLDCKIIKTSQYKPKKEVVIEDTLLTFILTRIGFKFSFLPTIHYTGQIYLASVEFFPAHPQRRSNRNLPVDSTILKACHIKPKRQNRVFRGVATKARSTIGRFFGFKLHLVINDVGEIMAFKITVGNVDDRDPVTDLRRQLSGKLFQPLMAQGVQLVTGVKKNMTNKLMPLRDKL